MRDVVVAGGGVIGLAIARELGRERRVLLMERGAAEKARRGRPLEC